MVKMNLFWIFVILNIVNVVIQTAKSLITVKCGKWAAAVANAVAYGLYTVVLIYMVCELPLGIKVAVVALCNFFGVLVVKWIEEKLRKDKLWKVEATIKPIEFESLSNALTNAGLPFNYINLNKYYVFNIFCETQAESAEAREILNFHEAKYFVSESKNL